MLLLAFAVACSFPCGEDAPEGELVGREDREAVATVIPSLERGLTWAFDALEPRDDRAVL